jgi:hypothetical protein
VDCTGIGEVYDPPLVGDVHDIDIDVCAHTDTVSANADTTPRIATLIFTEDSLNSLNSLPELLLYHTGRNPRLE